jgi:hypothetical protein
MFSAHDKQECNLYSSIIVSKLKTISLPMKSFIFLVSLIILLPAQDLFATHMMGGEINYISLGNDKFVIMVKVYRDCNGIPYSNTPLTIIPQGGGSTTTKSLTQVSVTDITPVCYSVTTKCAGGSFSYGAEEYVLMDTIDLSPYTNFCEFLLSWEQNARNSSITTGQADENFVVTAKLNKCVSNSSVIFTTRPHVIIVCAGQNLSHNIGAIDTIDHDSLSFELDSALQAVGVSNTYSGSYTYKRPMQFLGFPNESAALPAGFHLDPQNGDLQFRPTQLQVAIVSIKVTEWRKINGIITSVGETHRDIQVIVTNCNNSIPSLLGPYNYDVNAGNKVCFNMMAIDSNFADSILLSWNSGIPGGTFTTAFPTGSKKETGTFCWTPTNADVSPTPYMFTVVATDNACPLNGKASRTYLVNVKGTGTGSAEAKPQLQEIKTFPNPASNTFEIMINSQTNEAVTFLMYDVTGMQLKEMSLQPGKSEINCEGLRAGIYIITVTDSKGFNYRSRVLVQ